MRALQECMETYIFLLNQRGAPEFNNCICNPYWAPERKHVHNSTYAYRIHSKLYTDLQHKIPNPFLLQKVQYIYIYLQTQQPINQSHGCGYPDWPKHPKPIKASRPIWSCSSPAFSATSKSSCNAKRCSGLNCARRVAKVSSPSGKARTQLIVDWC